MPPSRPSCPARCILLATVVATVALGAAAAPALAKGGPKFQRGGLPSIGEITLKRTAEGRAQIAVPVTYTKALSGPPRGLESSVVALHVAAKLNRGRPVGTAYAGVRHHRLHGSGTIIDRFTLSPRKSRWLLGLSRKLRGKLVRVDVQHLVKVRRGQPPLHEKAASLNLASSHRAHPQGASGILSLRNGTNEPIQTVATPIMCMYTDGEEGSDLQPFNTQPLPFLPAKALPPSGTIEAYVEADGSIFDDAEYQGPTGASAGQYLDVLGPIADGIADAFELDLSFFDVLDALATHCDAVASTFMLAAANASGAGSSQAWVLTDENCRFGCPQEHLISDYEALGFQNPGVENGSELWASASTELLERFVGFYNPGASYRGQIVRDDGLHFEWNESASDRWEVTVGEGSKPAGFSG